MPVYNVEKYIGISIQSVLDQTYTDWELIIVNDGSTDNTLEAARSFSDSRIKIIYQHNSGTAVARNTGIEAAQGEFIAFLDGDDRYENSFLEIMAAKIKGNFIYSGFYRFWDNGKVKYPKPVYAAGNALYELLTKSLIIHINSVMIRREFLIESGIRFTPGCIYYEDGEFINKCFCLTSAEYVPQPLIGYRQARFGSICNQQNHLEKQLSGLGSIKRSIEFIEKNYTGEKKKEILEHSINTQHYTAYRAILAAIRDKKYSVAESLLSENQNIEIKGKNRKIRHILRLALIKSKNRFIWKLL